MKRISHKAKEAWRKNLSKWEDKQRATFFLLGAGLVIIIWLASL